MPAVMVAPVAMIVPRDRAGAFNASAFQSAVFFAGWCS
jgi:hypothetical protein